MLLLPLLVYQKRRSVGFFFFCSFNFVHKSCNILVLYSDELQDEMFASCRFSVDNSGDEVLYIAAKTGKLTF